ncbi:MAG: M20/M25/M40 family metallo-hydrolase [Phycisphaerae bacterium]
MLEEEFKQRYVEDICQFVRIPSITTAQGGQEGPLQALVAEQMRLAGARVRTFEVDDIPEFRTHPLCHGPDRNYKNRPTVIGELGPEDAPALLVMAHSDTVPIFEPNEWTFDPFLGQVKDNVIYGLGTTDDKWGVATMITAIRALKPRETQMRRKVIFVSTIDEESGVGNGMLLLKLAGIKAEAAFYLDGYQLNILLGTMGGSSMHLHAKDSMDPEKYSRHFADLHAACIDFSRRRASLFNKPLLNNNAIRDSSVCLRQSQDEKVLSLMISFYTLPDESREGFSGELESLVKTTLGGDYTLYNISVRQPWFEPAITPLETPFVKCLGDSIRQRMGYEPVLSTVSKQDIFVIINHCRIPSVSFGCLQQVTGRGAFHQPDECLSITEAWNGCSIAYGAICRWLEN